jgi:acyl-CoA thioester hydrolase
MKFLRENLPEYDPMMANIVLARIEIDFKKSIMLDDAITLETSIESMGRTSVRFLQRIVAESSEETYSVAKVTAVFIDRNRRPVPVPEAIRNTYSDGSGNIGNPSH